MSDLAQKRDRLGRLHNTWWISGWSYSGRILLERLPKDLQEKLRRKGNAVTVEEFDRYIRYVNNGLVTASSRKPVVDFHKRFKKRLGIG